MSYLHDLNSYDCGCKIVSEFPDRRGAVLMKWCALHKAAPDLLEACHKAFNAIEAGKSYAPSYEAAKKLLHEVITKAESRE